MKFKAQTEICNLLIITGDRASQITVLLKKNYNLIEIEVYRDSQKLGYTGFNKILDYNFFDEELTQDTEYEYTVTVICKEQKETIKIKVKTEKNSEDEDIFVLSNKGSWCYQGINDKKITLKQLEKLSFGYIESVIQFIDSAIDENYELKVALYQFNESKIAAALKKATTRGVDLKIFSRLDRQSKSKNKSDDEVISEFDKTLKVANLEKYVIRGKKYSAIFHNKFIILEHKTDSTLDRLYTGSANFTLSGFYQQFNVGFILKNKEIIEKYKKYWNIVIENPKPQKKKFDELERYSVISEDISDKSNMKVVFSPQNPIKSCSGPCHLAKMMAKSKSFNCITLPFKLSSGAPELIKYIEKDDKKATFILFNTLEDNSKFYKVPSNIVSSGKMFINTIKGDFIDIEKEHDPKFSNRVRFVHAKILMIDPLLPKSKIIVGSGNFSKQSFTSNDENYLIIENNPRVAHILYMHYIRIHNWFKMRNYKYITRYLSKNDLDTWYEKNLNKTEYDVFLNLI